MAGVVYDNQMNANENEATSLGGGSIMIHN